VGYNEARIVAQPGEPANPAVTDRIRAGFAGGLGPAIRKHVGLCREAPRPFKARQGRVIRQVVGKTVRSGGSASTVRKP
jgi:hypothetical protein